MQGLRKTIWILTLTGVLILALFLPRGGIFDLVESINAWADRMIGLLPGNRQRQFSYFLVLSPYALLLLYFIIRYRTVFRFQRWSLTLPRYFSFLILFGFLFEFLAIIFKAWEFPAERHVEELLCLIPVWGYFTGHKVPIEELLWIILVVPLFYFFFLHTTLWYHDIAFYRDEKGRYYKKEERWVGGRAVKRILMVQEGPQGYEKILKLVPPGVVPRMMSVLWKTFTFGFLSRKALEAVREEPMEPGLNLVPPKVTEEDEL